MNDNFFIWINDGITRLLTSQSGTFYALGMQMLRSIALFMVIVRGLGVAFSVSDEHHGMSHMRGLFQYFILIVITSMMLKYYNNPVPGVGENVHGIITAQGATLAAKIDTSITERLMEKFNTVIIGMESPNWYSSMANIGAALHYYLCVLAISLIQMVMLGVIAFGWVAVGVIVLVGPMFIPLLLLPKFESYFWNWFSALVQYSFYPVIANAFVYVYGLVLIRFFDAFPGPYTMDKISGMFLTLLCLAMALVWGFFKIPGLVSDIFRGSSGQHTMPMVGWWRG